MPLRSSVSFNSRGQRGADLFVEVLRSEGVRYVFGNPGTTELALLDALSGASDIQYILGLQEASVVAMADGYAQASGRPGFVNLHTAGGLGNAMGAILNAKMANTPLVITAGQQDTRHGVTDPLLHGDLVALARPSVKWAEEIHHPEHIPMLLRRAFQDCRTGPAGPVFLSLPINVMEQHTDVTAGPPSRIERGAVTGAIEELAVALATITPGRLAIIVGEEVIQSSAEVEAVMLAEALGAPVMPAAVGTSLGLDRSPVVCLVGDGSAMYSPQALWTAAHERLPVTFVVMNNGEYNILKNYARSQAHYLSASTDQFIGMDLCDPAIDFLALASSLGIPSRRIERAGDIAGAVEEGIRSGCPNLIELPIMP
ncbi:thiamine pyrophosphate-binding protein [Pseudomonas ogarae]|uniref:Benzoylformate decarboxylase n=1 Tax=Pseudomonas ogarae (strain DSM 112162 / CECT 30235 / F113) TaxID=1114970 RepID=A0ABM6R1P3_PSEO1|nr:thiamine pyrophosphate-binding protein [Pseudomonas ogarae]AEV63486.1 Benzoylformate decarboxylase [Pseudomonas ogarae]AUO47332.1 benzoylformate decarboxylase [Pseudomonas ogarae]